METVCILRTGANTIDVFEVGLFQHDSSGRKLAEPILGLRFNDGPWCPVRDIEEAIEAERLKMG